MKLRLKPEPKPEERSLGNVNQVPLGEAFYIILAKIAPDVLLNELFDDHRGRCYTDVLTFAQIVFILTAAITRYQGSGNKALENALDNHDIDFSTRAFYAKLSRLPLEVSEALVSSLTARLRPLFPAQLSRNVIPSSLAKFNLVIIDGKKLKKVAKKLLCLRGLPGKVFGGKILAAYNPKDGLIYAMACDLDGNANDVRLMSRTMPLVRNAIGGPRLWIADRGFCDLKQPIRFCEDGDHFLVRFAQRCKFIADPEKQVLKTLNEKGQEVTQEWGWMGVESNENRRYVRMITLDRGSKEAVILVTDLLDAAEYLVVDLLNAYLMRWQIETVFQEITEVFSLEHLIGSRPQATLFQAALCMVIYNVIQVQRAYATLAAQKKQQEQEEAKAKKQQEAERRTQEQAQEEEAKRAQEAAKAKEDDQQTKAFTQQAPTLNQAAGQEKSQSKQPTAKKEPRKLTVEDLSSRKIFSALHEDLITLRKCVPTKKLVEWFGKPLTYEELKQRLEELMGRGSSQFWVKPKSTKPRIYKPKAKKSGAHTSAQREINKAKAAKAQKIRT